MEQDIDPYPAGVTTPRRHTAWQLVRIYWQSNQRFPAYIFFSIIMIMTVSLVGLDVIFNYYYYYFYDVLQGYDKHGAIRLFLVFSMLSAFYILFEGYRLCVSQLFGMRWRRWMTQAFIKRCTQTSRSQKMQHDVDELINYSFDLSMGLIGVITTFLVLVYVLWQMSDTIHVSLGTWGTLTLPGYLVWIGVIYALGGTYLTLKTGRPLISSGDTSGFSMFPVRKLSEQKSLLGGMLAHQIPQVIPQKLLSRFSMGCYQLSIILPLIIVLPSYFDKVFLLSWLLQSLKAFNRVQDMLSFLVTSYSLAHQQKETQTAV